MDEETFWKIADSLETQIYGGLKIIGGTKIIFEKSHLVMEKSI